jgi:putative tryptophan/tyrosine transport system substrate-binding protein
VQVRYRVLSLGAVMRRRDFIALLSGAAAAWPLRALAQQSAMPVIGFLSGSSPAGFAIRLRAFRQGLKDAGYVEGQNVITEYRWAEGQNARIPALAADLVQRQVAVIVAGGTVSALAVKAATATIPIVFEVGVDPVASGLVASLDRPGGNVTGVTNLNVEVGPKRLELMHELLPSVTVIAALVNPTSSVLAEPYVRGLQAAARGFGLQLHVLNASTEQEFDKVFAELVQLRAGGLVITSDQFFASRIEQLAALTVRHAMPAIYQYHAFVNAGSLLSYGASETDNFRQVGNYVGKILKGEKPAGLPVIQSAKVELIVNLKAAKALGLTVPMSLLGRADEVIE